MLTPFVLSSSEIKSMLQEKSVPDQPEVATTQGINYPLDFLTLEGLKQLAKDTDTSIVKMKKSAIVAVLKLKGQLLFQSG